MSSSSTLTNTLIQFPLVLWPMCRCGHETFEPACWLADETAELELLRAALAACLVQQQHFRLIHSLQSRRLYSIYAYAHCLFPHRPHRHHTLFCTANTFSLAMMRIVATTVFLVGITSAVPAAKPKKHCTGKCRRGDEHSLMVPPLAPLCAPILAVWLVCVI
jgi:hypothetical protein